MNMQGYNALWISYVQMALMVVEDFSLIKKINNNFIFEIKMIEMYLIDE